MLTPMPVLLDERSLSCKISVLPELSELKRKIDGRLRAASILSGFVFAGGVRGHGEWLGLMHVARARPNRAAVFGLNGGS